MITLRTWPAARCGGPKRWAVQWDRGAEYHVEVYDDEATARTRYSEASLAGHVEERQGAMLRVQAMLGFERPEEVNGPVLRPRPSSNTGRPRRTRST